MEESEPQPVVVNNDVDERHCWVCFALEEDDQSAHWVRPCNCRGTSKWVHEKCLLRWVDEKQKGNYSEKVSCPQCNAYYIIVYPDAGAVVVFLDLINSVIYKVSPFMAAGLVVGSVYWVAVSFGAITVMQTMGQEDGQSFLEMSDPSFLLIILPTIPAGLILGKTLQWEDALLSFLRRNGQTLPLLNYIMPSIVVNSTLDEPVEEPYPFLPPTTPISATRILCSALIFPTVATIVGSIFFRNIRPPIQRTAMGALAFIILNGVFKLYHKEQNYVRRRKRTIMDSDDKVLSPTADPRP